MTMSGEKPAKKRRHVRFIDDGGSNTDSEPIANPSMPSKAHHQEAIVHTRKSANKPDFQGRRPLQIASSRGDLVLVKQLLALKVNVDSRDNAGTAALHEAALKGHASVVEALITAGAICDVRSGVGEFDTPLIDATANGHLEVVRILLSAGADPRIINAEGRVALDFVDNDHPDAALLRNALIKQTEEFRRSGKPLVDSKDHDLAPRALFPPSHCKAKDDAPVFVGYALNESRTEKLLVDRASRGDIATVGQALQIGWKLTPLALIGAAKYGHSDLVSLLLAMTPGADVDFEVDGVTALEAAVSRDHLKTAELLVGAGAKCTRNLSKYVAGLPHTNELWQFVTRFVSENPVSPQAAADVPCIPQLTPEEARRYLAEMNPAKQTGKEEEARTVSYRQRREHERSRAREEAHHLRQEREAEQRSNGAADRDREHKRIEERDRRLQEYQRKLDGERQNQHRYRHTLETRHQNLLKRESKVNERESKVNERENKIHAYERNACKHEARVNAREHLMNAREHQLNKREARILALEAGRKALELDTAEPAKRVAVVHDPRTSGPKRLAPKEALFMKSTCELLRAEVTEAVSVDLPSEVPTTSFNDVFDETPSESSMDSSSLSPPPAETSSEVSKRYESLEPVSMSEDRALQRSRALTPPLESSAKCKAMFDVMHSAQTQSAQYLKKQQAALPLYVCKIGDGMYMLDLQIAWALGITEELEQYSSIPQRGVTPQEKCRLWQFCRQWFLPERPPSVARLAFEDAHLSWLPVDDLVTAFELEGVRQVQINLEPLRRTPTHPGPN